MQTDMAIERDPDSGAVYCAFGRQKVAATHHLSDVVLVDVDAVGDVIGVEFAAGVDYLSGTDG